MSGSRLTARFGLFGALAVLVWSVSVLLLKSGFAPMPAVAASGALSAVVAPAPQAMPDTAAQFFALQR